MSLKPLMLAAVAALFSSACGRQESPSHPTGKTAHKQAAPPVASVPVPRPDADLALPRSYAEWNSQARVHWEQKISREQKKYWLEQESLDSLRKKQEEWVRRNYIHPAPAGFKPENVRFKLKLTLIPEKSVIRRGEPFRYRLEMQNVGPQPMRIFEPYSEFLLGNHFSGKYDFYFRPPGGKAWSKFILAMIRGIHGDDGHDSENDSVAISGGDRMTEKERDVWLRRRNAEENIRNELCAVLQPGEILVSKRWGGAAGSLNEMPVTDDWSRVGTYSVKATYDDSTIPPPTVVQMQRVSERFGKSREAQLKSYRDYRERARDSAGLVESNVAVIEVVP